eukprot:1952716-Prymnesium_polylepis.1
MRRSGRSGRRSGRLGGSGRAGCLGRTDAREGFAQRDGARLAAEQQLVGGHLDASAINDRRAVAS